MRLATSLIGIVLHKPPIDNARRFVNFVFDARKSSRSCFTPQAPQSTRRSSYSR